MELRRWVSLDMLAGSVMAKAVLDDMGHGRLRGLAPPAPYRIAKVFGLRAEQIRFLWDCNFERVGTRAVAKLAGAFGYRPAHVNGKPVLAVTRDTRLAVPDGPAGVRPLPVETVLARIRKKWGERQRQEAALMARHFSKQMEGAL